MTTKTTLPNDPGPGISPACISLAPGSVRRNALSTDSQNRCGSRFSRSDGTQPTRPAMPSRPVHDRSSTVFPLPAGADSTVTRVARSRSNNPGRDRTLPARPRPVPFAAALAGP
jgi:hypothetical protein